MEYGLIGEKLTHSYSPQIHRQLADYSYVLKPMPPEALKSFLLEKDFCGINVTIPYKQAVIPFCDALSPEAAEIQSVNTIVKQKDGSLFGHNTDIDGFISMLQYGDISVKGKKVIVLGSGGTSKTACAALRRLDAKEFYVISRSGAENYENLYTRHADAQVIVNTTPVGMYPGNGLSPIDLRQLKQAEAVVDVIYNPEKTALLLDAEMLGLKTVSGLPMLVAQARKAAELFLGNAISADVDKAIVSKIKKEILNLVLIGMPGSGKTSLGKILAQKMQRPLIDTDAEIEKKAGKTIPEIFSQDGEAAFRALETECVRQACSLHGHVIVTGGGAVLSEENRRHIRQNARVCLVNRSLCALSTEGRPLSTDRNALYQLWEQRKEKYQITADYLIDNNSELENAANAVLEGFYEAACD